MTEQSLCPNCGRSVPGGVLGGLCPECMLKVGAAVQTGDTGSEETAPPSARQATASPEQIARYFPQLEVLELIGKGGMGAVYKARQPALDRCVALKILTPQAGGDPGFAERFTREARALARLSHPNIVAVYEFGQVEGLHYFIMEYVDGTNLRQVERSGKLSPCQALAIIPQICEALQFAHDEGIVHRDIKPENILLDRKGRVKIADFGLAKILGTDKLDLTLTADGHMMGTPHYMAPEQVEHPQAVDHRADIYSLGVVFYEMLTGELPMGKFAPPSRKVQIDVRLDEVVLRALEKEPDRRYQHVSQVKTEVEQISKTSKPSAPLTAAAVEKLVGGRRGLQAGPRMLVKLAAWTAVVVCGWLFPILVTSHLFWLPWTAVERHEMSLWPQSCAYPDVQLRAARTLYHVGNDWLVAKGAWTATAKIDLPGPNDPAILEFDSYRERWIWGRPPALLHSLSRIMGEISPPDVVEWMKDAGIDTSRPGVQEEAAELIRLVKDAASGVQPEGGYFTCPPEGPVFETKVGRFTLVRGASGYEGGNYLQGWHYLLVAGLVLAVWYPGVRIIVRRHRRRLGATGVSSVSTTEKESDRRYQQASQLKTAVETISKSCPPTDASPQPADWRTWSPFQSPQVREICAHMTEAERREVTLRGTLFGIWNAATFFVPWGIFVFAPKPVNWIFAPIVLLVGLAFYPLWRRITREFLVSTIWARQQGIAPESLPMSPHIILVGRRNGQAVIHWRGVLLSFVLILALAEAGAIFASIILVGNVDSRFVGIAFMSAVIFTGILIRRGLTTPVEQLRTLNGPEAEKPSNDTAIVALLLSLGGCLLSLLLGLVVFQSWGWVFGSFFVIETAAIILGIVAWDKRTGKAAVILSFALMLAWIPGVIWHIAQVAPLTRTSATTAESVNRVLEVRCEGPKAYIRAELDDLHDLYLFIGSDALGWSAQQTGSTSVTATVEASNQVKLADGSLGSRLIFQAWSVRHYIAITPEGTVPYGEVVLRPNSGITMEDGTFTFADIRQADGALIPVSIRVRPVSGKSPGSQSFGNSYRDGFGSFNAFRTRSNTMGVYQFEGVDNSTRRGVGIRFKLAQPGEGASVPANPAKAGMDRS